MYTKIITGKQYFIYWKFDKKYASIAQFLAFQAQMAVNLEHVFSKNTDSCNLE